MQHETDESRIYLKDLLFSVLYRWRAVIAAALVLAIALGGMKLFSGLSALKGQENQSSNLTAQLEKYEAEKDSLEQRVNALLKQVMSQNEYLENSVYMQLDPYAFYEGTVALYFDTDYQILPGMSQQNPDPTDSIIATYQSLLDCEELLLPLSQAVDTLPQYVEELLTVTVDTAADMMTIRLRYPDQTGAEALVAVLTEQIKSVHAQVDKAVIHHQVSIVSQTVSKRVDYTIAEMQNTEAGRMTTLSAELADMQAKLNGLVKPGQQTRSKTAVLKDAVIFAIVGCVLGAFLVACVCCVSHICTDKIYSARTLKNRTGIKILGCVGDKKMNPIDRWLRKLEGRNCDDPQLQAQLLAVDILNRCGDASSLLVAGSANAESRQQILQALSAAKPGMQITDAGNIIQDVTALEALSDCNAVLLVEQCGLSTYSNTAQQVEWINDYNKQLIGCVLLGG